MGIFLKESFEHGRVQFNAKIEPVSLQNNIVKKDLFKSELQKITSKSDYIITGTCWIAIDYFCQHMRRFKNPGAYDVDNIIKPILDALVGSKGLVVDDVIVDRVTVNWIDTSGDDYISIEIEYPGLLYMLKSDLVFLKSKSNWCFPATRKLIGVDPYIQLIQTYFNTWDSIRCESDYYLVLGALPNQNFIYFTKVRDRGYEFIEIDTIKSGES